MDAEKAPSIGISLQVSLDAKHQLVLQSFIDRDCDGATLDALLDKLRVATERQFAVGQVMALKDEIEKAEREAVRQQFRIAKTEAEQHRVWNGSGRKGDLRLTQVEQQKRQEAIDTAEALKDRVGLLRKELTKWEAVIAS